MKSTQSPQNPPLSIKKTAGIISSAPIKTGTASVFSKNGCRGRFIMSKVGAADRERLLRSKRSELSGIVTSRKRKLREFFAVCDNEGPLPQITLSSVDAPPTTAAEKQFLDVSDILLNRSFDESNLPARRQLRSNSLKQRSPIRKASPDARTTDSSRKATKAPREGSRNGKSRATTPSAKSDSSRTTPVVEIRNGGEAVLGAEMRRSLSKGSQTDLPAASSAVLNEIVEETFQKAAQPQSEMQDNIVPSKDLESDRIRMRVESRPNSPGVDPRKAMPISAEDAAELDEPLVEGLGSHDTHHKAATVHLPPKEVQERHIREKERAREQKDEARHLSINLPPRDGNRHAELLSSPGSTVDAQSATTPALHDASTDTSPENDNSRYDAENLDKDDEVQTPEELKPTPEEVAEKEQHDRMLNAQIEVSRAEILGSSPSAADNQLRMEEQAASLTETAEDEQQQAGIEEGEGSSDRLTKEASEVVQDVIEDEDEVVAVPTPEDVPMSGMEQSPEKLKAPESKLTEVADSEAEAETPVDAMDVDPPATVKDSFESNEALESRAASSPVMPDTAIEAPQVAVDQKKSASSTPAASTPRRTPSSAAATPTMERMTTRVSSGVLKHRHINEIIAEPRSSTSTLDKGPGKLNTDSGSAENSSSPSRSTTPQSPGARLRSLAEKKERERSKLSTVTFSRRNKSGSNDTALMPSGPQSSKSPPDDYFKPLFIASATADRKSIPTLDSLLATAHKTITTANAYLPLHETQANKVLKRIYQLQASNKWTLRQPKRAPEPNRPTTQWDVLLQEVKWMRTDFREERKWKMTMASNMAFTCAEWVEASPEDQKLLQVNATIRSTLSRSEAESRCAAAGIPLAEEWSHATPDLVESGELDSPMEDLEEEPRLNLMETVAPTAIFALQDNDVVFGLRRSPNADKLLAELPLFGAPLSVPQSEISTSDIDPDRAWRRPALPLSKYVEGRMELISEGPPRKRSRFQYEEEDDDDDEVVFGDQGKTSIVPPETNEVALFDPQHKHIRDRIHSSHQFRPPSEFPMPLQSFFETRIASQWTWDEDNELKTLVRDYSYNWSLISSILASKSAFSSGAERRTPWECFERWIHLEGLPADMQKTHYFRAYTTRIEAANRNVLAQAPAQPGNLPNGQIQPPSRRRTTTSVRVERRRNQKHLTLVDAMRKLAKKRETNVQKQQQAAGMAAMRKANENQNARQPGQVNTPQYFSKMKHERDEQFKERILALQQRQEAQRRAVLAQQRNPGQTSQQPGLPNGTPQQRGPAPVNGANGSSVPNGTPSTSGQNLTVPGQNRPPRPMAAQMGQPISNGLRVPQMPMNGMPPGSMQGMPGQMPMQPTTGLVISAAQTAESQRALILKQQQQGNAPGQSPQMHNSPPRANGIPQPHGFPMQNMMAFNGNMNGMSTPPMNGMASSPGPGHGQASSPRMGQLPYSQETTPNPIPRMEAALRKQYPNAPNDQIMAMMTEHLKRNAAQQRQGLAQSAMNAAAGSGNGMSDAPNGQIPGASNNPQGSAQAYAQLLARQQQNQQKQDQARQAANALSANPGQNNQDNRPPVQGHTHRNSSGSVQSGK